MPIARWRGEPLEGKRVLIWSEEGLGDQIMYARFAPLLQARAGSVVWVTPPELSRLFGLCLGVEVVTINTGPVPGVVDYLIPSSALPVQLMAERVPIPPAPYLKPPPANAIPGLTIGVMARGNPEHQNDRHRSLPRDMAERLLALPGAVSLAPEETGARDFYDTATVIAGLDLVISVDTAVAHLAGAMGKPLWLLLSDQGVDWRWQTAARTSLWYPSATLFRRRKGSGWGAVIEDVRNALDGRGAAA